MLEVNFFQVSNMLHISLLYMALFLYITVLALYILY